MKFTQLALPGLVIIEPDVFNDNRGQFLELYKKDSWKSAIGLQNAADLFPNDFLQDNLSLSKKNVIRGLHFQIAPFEQGKLVTVIKGAVLDVAVDLRRNSSTFGKYIACELNEKNRHLFWIPPGFAHGFASLEDDTSFLYKCSNVYHKASERGIRYNDSDLNIQWKITNPIVSEKDIILPTLKEFLAQ